MKLPTIINKNHLVVIDRCNINGLKWNYIVELESGKKILINKSRSDLILESSKFVAEHRIVYIAM